MFKLARRVYNWGINTIGGTDLLIVFWLINDAQTNEAKVWPRLQFAFESRVFGMSCILYRLTQLAAFFLDQRAEWSTTNSCYCLLNLMQASNWVNRFDFGLKVGFREWKGKRDVLVYTSSASLIHSTHTKNEREMTLHTLYTVHVKALHPRLQLWLADI